MKGHSIVCDNCGESSRPSGDEQEALDNAVADGFEPRAGKDYCPNCIPERGD